MKGPDRTPNSNDGLPINVDAEVALAMVDHSLGRARFSLALGLMKDYRTWVVVFALASAAYFNAA